MEVQIDRRRLVWPKLGALYERLAPYSYAFMRFSAGAVLVPHGYSKLILGTATNTAGAIAQHGFPFPTLLGYLAGFNEFVVAICLALGLFTRPAALIVWAHMTIIIVFFQWPFGYFWTNRGIEFALLWWLLCIGIFFRGGGRYSLDRLLGWEV